MDGNSGDGKGEWCGYPHLCPQTWLENPTFVDDFHSDKPPLTGSFHCHVWLARVVWYGEPGCWAMEEMLFDSYHWHPLDSISFVVTATNTCHPRGSGLHGYVYRQITSPSSSPIVPHLAAVGSSRMARCCWTKKLKSLSKRQSLNSWVPGYQSITLSTSIN
jgi:hypothetical protein